jgi:hypothetical protein
MEMSGQFHDLTTLPLGNQPWYTLDIRLGGPQSWSGHSREEKNLAIPRIKNGAVQPHSLLLYQLSYTDSCYQYMWLKVDLDFKTFPKGVGTRTTNLIVEDGEYTVLIS